MRNPIRSPGTGLVPAGLLLSLLLIAGPGFAQSEEPPAPMGPRILSNRAEGLVIGNEDDSFVGVGYRRSLPSLPSLGVIFLGLGRLWHETVLEPLGPHLYLQQLEKRFYLAAGGDAAMPIGSRLELSVRAGVGYTFADFEATSGTPEEGWVPFLGGRASLRLFGWSPRTFLTLGYLHADIKSDDPNWIEGGLGVAW